MTTSSTGLTAARFTALALAICTLVGGCVPSGAGEVPGPRPALEEVWVPRGDRSPIRGLLARVTTSRAQPAVLGFCFGGRVALLYAAFNPRAVPVVSIYGNLRLPPEAMRTTEPWNEIDAFDDPVLGVYATRDREAPVADAQAFFDGLRDRGNPVELHVFDAAHGFFDPARPSFDRAARDSAWQEIVSFLMRAQ